MITLGIDIGTTHTKVLALDVADGATLVLESAPTPVRRTAAGEAHRPADVLVLVLKMAARVTAALPSAGDVRAICVASVGEEVVLLDRAGSPLADAIAWYDPRGFDQAHAFLKGPGGATSLSRRQPPDRTFSLFKLLWTRDHEPNVLAAAAGWTDLGDYVLHGLGGELVMDRSHASRAGALDIVTRAWDSETIEAAALGIAFPRLVPSGSVVGTLGTDAARTIGIGSDVALVSGGHDHLVAAFGAGIRSPRELFLSAGTSEAHLALLEAPLVGEAARGIDQGCYVDDHAWYAHINIHSGHFFEQWRSLLFEGVADEAMYAQLAAADSGGISFEPTDDLRLGNLTAVPYDVGRAALMRAVLEGLARRSAAIVDRLEAAGGSPFELILAAGHPTRIPLWRALRRAAYGRPVATVAEAEPTAFGAAVLAARALDPDRADGIVARRSGQR
jgi:sugar (pentulose or hexulose) kinase